MCISILVVDDIRPIAEGFGGKFRRYSEEHFHVLAEVEILCSADEAVRRISDESKPKFDLLFTDIDLSGGEHPNKDGVAFARFARSLMPDIPLIGCSGRFEQDDLSEEDRDLFDNWWSKGRLSEKLEEISKDTLSRAISYHHKRHADIAGIEGNDETLGAATGSGLITPVTNEEFLAEGYVKSVIEPSVTNGLVEPFAVWVKNSEEGVELEVVGCGAVFTWGDTYEDAEAGLMEIISDMKRNLHEPDDSFSQSLLLAKRFVETVTGARNMVEEV